MQKGDYKEEQRSFGVRRLFSTLTVVMASCLQTHVKPYQVIHLNYVQFIMCRLYFNKPVILKGDLKRFIN